jgi:hypothetical protein
MSKYLDKNISKLILIFIFLQPIIDLLTSISINYLHLTISVGIVVRSLFLVLIIYYYVFIRKISKKQLMYLLGILVFSLSFIIFIYLSKEPMSSNIVSLVKYLYFIILLILIDSKDLKISKRNLFYIALIYILLIFVPRMLSLDFNSYREGNIGSVGIFNSGNEINAILVFLLPIYLTNLLKEQSLAYRLIFFAVMAYVSLLTGTKVLLFFFLLITLIKILPEAKKLSNKAKIVSLIGVGITCALLVILIPKTNFYHNIMLSLEYNNINSLKDIFSYNFLNNVIFHERLTFLVNNFNIYINSGIRSILFGIGLTSNSILLKEVEMDLYDILITFGIIGTLLLVIPVIKYLISLNKQDKDLIIGTIFLLIVSIISGHVLLSPAVSIYLIIGLKNRIE